MIVFLKTNEWLCVAHSLLNFYLKIEKKRKKADASKYQAFQSWIFEERFSADAITKFAVSRHSPILTVYFNVCVR